MAKLEQWGVCERGDCFAAPETRMICLTGIVYGHPVKPDGKEIVTNAIAAVDGRIITTYSGTEYVLGEPAPKYLQYLKDNGYEYNENFPIRMK
jgi:hypothetical protein